MYSYAAQRMIAFCRLSTPKDIILVLQIFFCIPDIFRGSESKRMTQCHQIANLKKYDFRQFKPLISPGACLNFGNMTVTLKPDKGYCCLE